MPLPRRLWQIGHCVAIEPGIEELAKVALAKGFGDSDEVGSADISVGILAVEFAQNGEKRVVTHFVAQGVENQCAASVNRPSEKLGYLGFPGAVKL